MTDFILCHIVRARARAVLIATVAAVAVIAPVFLHTSLIRTAEGIDRMYDTTIVHAEVMQNNPADSMRLDETRRFGDIIRPRTVDGILGSGLVQNEYLEAIYAYTFITLANEDGTLYENWNESFIRPLLAGFSIEQLSFNNFVATNNLTLLLESTQARATHAAQGQSQMLDGMPDELQIAFGPGFDEADFVFTRDAPVPIIMAESIVLDYGITPGALLHLNIFRPAHLWLHDMPIEDIPSELLTQPRQHVPAMVIGTHNLDRATFGLNFTSVVLIIPLDAMESIFEYTRLSHEIGYTAFSFDINPEHNRDIIAVREELQSIVTHRRAGWIDLSLNVYDEELRIVVGSMDRNLSLLRTLYPVAIGMLIVISFSLSVFFMLQNTKNVAIMRILGSTKWQTWAVLWAEQLVLCFVGLIVGIAAVFIMGWSISTAAALAGLYIFAMSLGCVVGSLIVTRHSPLRCLQISE